MIQPWVSAGPCCSGFTGWLDGWCWVGQAGSCFSSKITLKHAQLSVLSANNGIFTGQNLHLQSQFLLA